MRLDAAKRIRPSAVLRARGPSARTAVSWPPSAAASTAALRGRLRRRRRRTAADHRAGARRRRPLRLGSGAGRRSPRPSASFQPGPTGRGWQPVQRRPGRRRRRRLSPTRAGGSPASCTWASSTAASGRPGDVDVKLSGAPADQRVPGGRRESYTLTAARPRLTLTGPDEAGVFYGTRTVRQAVRAAGGLPEGVVHDRPDRPQRGLRSTSRASPSPRAGSRTGCARSADLKLNQLGCTSPTTRASGIAERPRTPRWSPRDHLTKAQVRQIIALAAQPAHLRRPGDRLAGPSGRGDQGHYPGSAAAQRPGRVIPRRRSTSPTPRRPRDRLAADELLRAVHQPQGRPGAYWHLGGDEYQALTVVGPRDLLPAAGARPRGEVRPGAAPSRTWRPAGSTTGSSVAGQGQAAQGLERRLLRRRRASADRTVHGRVLDGQGGRQARPRGVPARGPHVMNLNDEYLYYVLGEPNDFTYPTGQRIYQSGPRGAARHPPAAVPANDRPGPRSPGRASRSGATGPGRRRRSRSPPASGCRWRRLAQKPGIRRRPRCPGRIQALANRV